MSDNAQDSGTKRGPQSFSLSDEEMALFEADANRLGYRGKGARGAYLIALAEASRALNLRPVLSDDGVIVLRPALRTKIDAELRKRVGGHGKSSDEAR